jgi:prepilin-type N-terminal cleavage/methylation domain-containing protein
MRTKLSGMTLIELLAAMAIAAAVMAAALTVTAGLSKADLRARAGDGHEALRAGLRNILTVDLTHAQWFRNTANGFELRTLAALEGQGAELRHLDTTVAYAVRPINGVQWLIRLQRITGGTLQITAMSPAITSVEIKVPIDLATPADPNGWRATPSLLAVVVRSGGEGEPVQALTFQTR